MLKLEVWHLFVLIELLFDMEYPKAYLRKWSTRQANRYLSKCSLKWFNVRQLTSSIFGCLFLQIGTVPHHQTLLMYLQELQQQCGSVGMSTVFLRSTSIFIFLREGFVYIENDLGKEKLCP